MTTSAKTDLASLKEGTLLLFRRPWPSLGIAAFGMLLAALAPLLQLYAGLPDEPGVDMLLTFVLLLPLDLYFIPRFLIAADALDGQDPLNPPVDWRRRFEERWLRACVGKALLAVTIMLGLVLAILPGLLVWLAFGWTPLRILLRGESLVQAARGSYQMMVRAWQRILLSFTAIMAIYLTVFLALNMVVDLAVPDPTIQVRLTHPLIWAGDFLGGLLNLWVSTCLLALYRRVEGIPPLAGTLPRAG
jgi:hypothetical protein